MKIWIIALPLCSCLVISCASPVSLSEREQAHCELKIDQLKEKISKVQNSMEASEENLKQLKSYLEEEEIAQIRLRIESFSSSLPELRANAGMYTRFVREELPRLFLKERKKLTEIIHSSDLYNKEAQDLLDQILRLITQLQT